MDDLRSSLIKQCADALKTERVRSEIRELCEPIGDVALQIIYPYIYTYIYIVFVLVFLLFVFIITILYMLSIVMRSIKVTGAIVEVY
jgi:hypothetical protein